MTTTQRTVRGAHGVDDRDQQILPHRAEVDQLEALEAPRTVSLPNLEFLQQPTAQVLLVFLYDSITLIDLAADIGI